MSKIYTKQCCKLHKLVLTATCVSRTFLPKKINKHENYFKLVEFNEPQNKFITNIAELYKIENNEKMIYYYFNRVSQKSLRAEDLIELNSLDYQSNWWLFTN